MAETSSGQTAAPSRKLIAVAIVLAVLVVVLYNYQVSKYRNAQAGKTVKLLRFNKDMQAGDRITAEALDTVEMPASFQRGLANCITADKLDYAVASTLNRPVRKGQWLLYEYTTNTERDNPSNRIHPDWVTQTITIDPQKSPGEVLSIGDRVNILAMLAVNGKPLRAYRVIQNVKVIAIGGRSYAAANTGSRRRSSGQPREYRKITIEVPPTVSLQLANILSHARAAPWIEVRNPSDLALGESVGQIDRELRTLSAAGP